MAKFYLIDHSIEGVGSHNCDYAVHVLRAAAEAGFRVVAATHSSFDPRTTMPAEWAVTPLFPHTNYDILVELHKDSYRQSTGRSGREPSGIAGTVRWGWWPLLKTFRFRRVLRRGRRRRQIALFTRCCRQIFRLHPIETDDLVFFPTLSQFELQGLVDYLESAPESQRADWHLQFHWNIFEGRGADYGSQTNTLESMRQIFAAALRRVASHRITLYTTSNELSEQYNQMHVGRFISLAYPINPAFHPQRTERPAKEPLQVLCAGLLRKEKGKRQLPHLIEELWNDMFATGKIQLVIQSKKQNIHLKLPHHMQSTLHSQSSGLQPIVYAQHPLGMSEYVDLISGADLGLLMYDSRRYYARRAGVLCELLCSGIPVVVPAGSWLAEQISPAIFQHLDDLTDQLELLGGATLREHHWQTSVAHESSRIAGSVVFGNAGRPATCELTVPPPAGELLLRFRWVQPTAKGTYVRIELTQYDQHNTRSRPFRQVVGHRSGSDTVSTLFHLEPSTTRIRLRWSNAYHDAPVTVAAADPAFYRSAGGRPCPAGAVGLIAADQDHYGRLVREIVEHLDHFRQTAVAFSVPWSRAHAPKSTLTQLVSHSRISLDA